MKRTIIQRQGNECAKCGKQTELEADHVHPISTDPFNRNDVDNLQLLCSECHLEKTTAQAFQNDFNPLLSYFNENAWANFVMSARPNQQVYRNSQIRDGSSLQNLDVTRCRRNMLSRTCYPWYVFSIWDDIHERTKPELSDFNYVSKAAPKNATEMVRQAPHVGPAWRTREVCAFLLNVGVLTWDDIPYGINATCRLPCDFLETALDKIDETREKTCKPDEKKLSINSMLGLWANPKQYSFLVKTHEPYMDDAVFEGVKVRRLLKEFALEEVVMRFEQVSNSTMSTIHRQVIDAEQVILAKMRRELMKCGLSFRELKEVRVDSCLIEVGKRKAEAVMQRMREITYDDLNNQSFKTGIQRYFTKNVVVEEASRISFFDDGQASKAFRADPIKNDATVILQGVHKLPTTEAESPTPCPEWTFWDKEAARKRVLEHHESIYLLSLIHI